MQIVVLECPARKPWRRRSTYRLIEEALRTKWKNVRSVSAATEAELRARLHACGPVRETFVFNVAEYLDERHKKGFIPGLLDDGGYAHLGSSAQTVRIGLDKARTKEILLRSGVPTPSFFVATPGDPDTRERAERIGYPLIVKPLQEGGQVGIHETSVVRNIEMLNRAILHVAVTYRQAALVEEFLGGEDVREYSVGIVTIGPRLHLPVEINWERIDQKTRILSSEASRRRLERKVKPVDDRATAMPLCELADRTFDALGAQDFAQVDIRTRGSRMDVLEIDITPGLAPGGFLSLGARAKGFDHEDLLYLLTRESMRRQGLTGQGVNRPGDGRQRGPLPARR